MTNQPAPAKPRRRKPVSPTAQRVKDVPKSGDADPSIRDAVIRAAVEAGEGNMVAYLKKQAETHPSAFLTLLGKVLPMQAAGAGGAPVNVHFSVHFVAGDSASQLAADNRLSADNK